jgi:hypothetical protein
MWNPYDDGRSYHQSSSFREPVTPPSTEACDPPLVCLSINQEWLPYVVGACMQLLQPSTWDVADDAARRDVLDRATDVVAEIGSAMPCTPPPPSPSGTSAADQACNIAGYLAHAVLRASAEQALNAYNADETLLGYGATILNLIPGGSLVVYGILLAVQVIWESVNGGNLADWTAAAEDDALWSHVTCAIYGAIAADGMVTDANFPAIVTAVGGVSYAHAEVVTGIVDFLNNLGAGGLESLQITGALASYDCSGCGGGVATGPAGPIYRSAAGSVAVTIAAGASSGATLVTFTQPFGIAPVIDVSSDNPNLIASVAARAAASFLATLKAATPVDADVTATVFWSATVPGSS